jgi:prevent-host-death family protein
MDTVGVRELKAHLSRCLRRVRAGVRVMVTDRGQAVAIIEPVDAPRDAAWARRMVADGAARWSGGKPQGAVRRAVSRGRPASAVVIDDRR